MKVAIYGAGSLGTVLGAYLTKNGIDVELVNRNKAHVEALRSSGAHIVGTIDMTVAPLRVSFPDEMTDGYDIIFLMTKQLQNREVVTALKPKLSSEGVIVTLQNGIPEPLIAEIVGSDRTIGVTVEWGATLKEPGLVEMTSDPDSLSFHMGAMEGVPQARLDAVKDVLEHMCPVQFEDNLIGARWSKLLINSTFSGIGAATNGTFGDVCRNPRSREIAIRCMKEVVDVGRASGATFAPVQGKDITKLFYWTNGLKKAFAKFLMPIAMRKHYNIYPSMLQDMDKGKKCEIDAINGVVCEFGRKYGIPTPVNDKVVEVVKAEEAGTLPRQASNIELFYE